MSNRRPKYPKSYSKAVGNGRPIRNINQKESIDSFKDIDDLHVADSSVLLKKICDGDDRYLVDAKSNPYKTICRLVIKSKGEKDELVGSGFFISPKVVLTSGHCVFRNGSWVESILVIPGDNGSKDRRPFGSQVSKVFKSVKGWTINRVRDFDYGAIVLQDSTLFNSLGKPQLFQPKIISTKLPLLNSGYTAKGKKFEQWACRGTLEKFTTYRIYYNNDTESGNSGSPILIENDNQLKVVGIHSFGECPNFCIRVNKRMLAVLKQWKLI